MDFPMVKCRKTSLSRTGDRTDSNLRSFISFKYKSLIRVLGILKSYPGKRIFKSIPDPSPLRMGGTGGDLRILKLFVLLKH